MLMTKNSKQYSKTDVAKFKQKIKGEHFLNHPTFKIIHVWSTVQKIKTHPRILAPVDKVHTTGFHNDHRKWGLNTSGVEICVLHCHSETTIQHCKTFILNTEFLL